MQNLEQFRIVLFWAITLISLFWVIQLSSNLEGTRAFFVRIVEHDKDMQKAILLFAKVTKTSESQIKREIIESFVSLRLGLFYTYCLFVGVVYLIVI